MTRHFLSLSLRLKKTMAAFNPCMLWSVHVQAYRPDGEEREHNWISYRIWPEWKGHVWKDTDMISESQQLLGGQEGQHGKINRGQTAVGTRTHIQLFPHILRPSERGRSSKQYIISSCSCRSYNDVASSKRKNKLPSCISSSLELTGAHWLTSSHLLNCLKKKKIIREPYNLTGIETSVWYWYSHLLLARQQICAFPKMLNYAWDGINHTHSDAHVAYGYISLNQAGISRISLLSLTVCL